MPAGVVGICSGDTPRFTEFYHAFMQLQTPPGWELKWERGISIAKNRNNIVEYALSKPEMEYVWFMDDDHVFEPDILLKLLARDVDIVSPLYARRLPLFLPHYYTYMDPECSHGYLVKCSAWEEMPREGIHEVLAVAGGGLLIKRKVLETMGFPWFTLGKYKPDGIHEDTWFSQKAREAGFKLYIDVENCLGHLTQGAVWPKPGYGVELKFGEFTLPVEIKRG